MFRVGLTGGPGSGKTTIGNWLRERGAHLLQADEIGRTLMQPGESVYRQIVAHFGPQVVASDGRLDRRVLADLAFREGHLQELNQIVHPAVIAAQEEQVRILETTQPDAIVVIESALIFEAEAGGTAPGWRKRFDRIMLVSAPDEIKIARFLSRILPPGATPAERLVLESDARRRLGALIPDSDKLPLCDYVIDNSGSLEEAKAQVDSAWASLRRAAGRTNSPATIVTDVKGKA